MFLSPERAESTPQLTPCLLSAPWKSHHLGALNTLADWKGSSAPATVPCSEFSVNLGCNSHQLDVCELIFHEFSQVRDGQSLQEILRWPSSVLVNT